MLCIPTAFKHKNLNSLLTNNPGRVYKPKSTMYIYILPPFQNKWMGFGRTQRSLSNASPYLNNWKTYKYFLKFWIGMLQNKTQEIFRLDQSWPLLRYKFVYLNYHCIFSNSVLNFGNSQHICRGCVSRSQDKSEVFDNFFFLNCLNLGAGRGLVNMSAMFLAV